MIWIYKYIYVVECAIEIYMDNRTHTRSWCDDTNAHELSFSLRHTLSPAHCPSVCPVRPTTQYLHMYIRSHLYIYWLAVNTICHPSVVGVVVVCASFFQVFLHHILTHTHTCSLLICTWLVYMFGKALLPFGQPHANQRANMRLSSNRTRKYVYNHSSTTIFYSLDVRFA